MTSGGTLEFYVEGVEFGVFDEGMEAEFEGIGLDTGDLAYFKPNGDDPGAFLLFGLVLYGIEDGTSDPEFVHY